MTAATLEEANRKMRAAVKERLDNTPADDPKLATAAIRGPSAAEVLERFNPTHPTSQRFYDLCDQLKAMHASKSSDYGCPSGNDPLWNIRNGATFVGIPAWQGAMVRLSDKVTRLATFNATGRLGHEGVEDTLLDLASYSLLALLLYQEEHDGASHGR
jgi:hypothetical protein